MSIAIAIKLDDNDLLLAADKRTAAMEPGGYISNANNTSTKLIPVAGGVMGFVGDPDLALSLIASLRGKEFAPNRVECEVSEAIREAYYRRIGKRSDDSIQSVAEAINLSGDEVRFVFGYNRSGRSLIVRFELRGLFQPRAVVSDAVATVSKVDWKDGVILGMDRHANMLRQWFQKPSYSSIDAQRLAALMIWITHEAEPNSVSGDLDMVLLKKDQEPRAINPATTKDWISDFVKETRNRFWLGA